MGFSTILDILGSMIIGGIILMMMGKINSNIVENTFNNQADFSSQQKMTNVALVLESDIKKIGYSADYLAEIKYDDCILAAESSKLTFLYDYNANGSLDTLSFYQGPTSELESTPNPEDRYLYKKINQQTPVTLTDGISNFTIKYYDFNDSLISAPVTNKGRIYSFEINISIEPADSIKNYEQNGGDPFPPLYFKQTRVTQRNMAKR